MKFINIGNFKNAQEELKNDKNNAVASIFEYDNNLNNGLLNDVVFTLKNNYAKKFDSTDASSNILKDFNPGYNATILEKLFNSGAKLVATTNLDEFGLGGT
ncbi:MAG: Asp-tRNA(Asn)/Glu-tRNA(Gln) amidotransferase GatCAB subunit A, partial [Mycoplasmataceae bacterium]|nr:Asp-tRNA(Asn)/Glu-tRNA(Gln) amidotransferase GatCAB subunit A [Mycoplasmataceae bacterium]